MYLTADGLRSLWVGGRTLNSIAVAGFDGKRLFEIVPESLCETIKEVIEQEYCFSLVRSGEIHKAYTDGQVCAYVAHRGVRHVIPTRVCGRQVRVSAKRSVVIGSDSVNVSLARKAPELGIHVVVKGNSMAECLAIYSRFLRLSGC